MIKAFAKWKFPSVMAAKKAIAELDSSLFQWGWRNEKTGEDYACCSFDGKDGTFIFDTANNGVIVTWKAEADIQLDLDVAGGDELWASPAALNKDKVEAFLFHVEQE